MIDGLWRAITTAYYPGHFSLLQLRSVLRLLLWNVDDYTCSGMTTTHEIQLNALKFQRFINYWMFQLEWLWLVLILIDYFPFVRFIIELSKGGHLLRIFSFPHSWLIFLFLFVVSFQPGCIILHLVLHYFMLCNYAWMLCEGFYLHTVLVSAFISEHRLVRWLMAFGWIAPVIIIISYGLFRGLNGTVQDNMQ